MQKTVLLLFANLSIFANSYSICKQDSIYRDLYAFLVERSVISEDMIPKFGSENYDKFLYLSNLLDNNSPHKPDLTAKFGLYVFQYSGCHCGFYILLIYENSYKIFHQDALPLIIRELLQIREKDPEILPYELFCNYLSELIKGDLELPVIMQNIGKIKYYMSR